MLTFMAKWEIEQGWDYVQCEITTNSGTSWIPLAGKYTVTGNEYQATGQPVYDGFQTSWIKEEVNLADYIGQEVSFRFFLKTDQGVTEDGFYFDDFSILGVENATVGIPEKPESYPVNISDPIPNPAGDRVNFNIVVNQTNETYRLAIYSLTGQAVYSETVNNGMHQLKIRTGTWESGIYFYRLENGNYTSEMKKLIIL